MDCQPHFVFRLTIKGLDIVAGTPVFLDLRQNFFFVLASHLPRTILHDVLALERNLASSTDCIIPHLLITEPETGVPLICIVVGCQSMY